MCLILFDVSFVFSVVFNFFAVLVSCVDGFRICDGWVSRLSGIDEVYVMDRFVWVKKSFEF